MSIEAAVVDPTYGNWRRPRRAGLGPFGLIGTVGVFGGIVLALFVSLASLKAALAVVVLLSAVLLPMAVRTQDGRNIYQLLAVRVGWFRRKAKGTTTYVSGPLSPRPGGRFRPPGLLSRVRVLEGRDAYDQPFGVLHHRSRNLYTIVLGCEPDGGSLVDPDQVDNWVASWGQWLARLSGEPGLRGASVVVETAPDTGTRLANEVLPRIDPKAPAAARAVMEEVVERYPAASSEMHTYLTLTYGTPSGQKRRTEDIVADLAVRIPGLLAGVVSAGGGPASPLSAERIAEVVRVAYDPAVAGDVLDARTRHGGTGLDWEDAGPAATVEKVNAYQHDSGVSRTWLLTLAPRGTVRANVLRGLLEDAPGTRRKRVALLYRPIDPATSARIVESDRRTAQFMATSRRGMVQARAANEVRAAEQTAVEEATGAGLVEFSLMVTVTVDTDEELADASATVRNLLAGARLLMRPADRMQAAAFSCTLPAGILPWEYTLVPRELKEAL
ncbi:SCO6880 family protein [Streptomyces sp. TRM 70361]|uniref:SCO6880 family protein n=1 Tax=Streptomyces sp. TRM 70361 TaxID=3116553 RepID=UPI002E7B7E17|nr:SCO6880 family protein [Streptomyces sp. TRM 70361]MEE1940974.1 SCO6880 family protein [Streptomyces sp. TRM 70361]